MDISQKKRIEQIQPNVINLPWAWKKENCSYLFLSLSMQMQMNYKSIFTIYSVSHKKGNPDLISNL